MVPNPHGWDLIHLEVKCPHCEEELLYSSRVIIEDEWYRHLEFNIIGKKQSENGIYIFAEVLNEGEY